MNRGVRRATAYVLIMAGVIWIALPGLCVLAFGGGSKEFLRMLSVELLDMTNPFGLVGLLGVLGGVILLFWRPRDEK